MTACTPLLISLAVASAAAAPTWAATTLYTSPASFTAALEPGAYVEAFTGGAGAAAPALDFFGGDFAYTVSASPGFIYRSGNTIGTYYADELLTVTFTAGAPTAVGGEFMVTDVADTFLAVPVTVTLGDGTTTTFTPTTQANSFRGFISTVAIKSLTMAAPGNFSPGRFNAIDNLIVGRVAAVPEAGTWCLLALGLAGLAFVRRPSKR